MSALIFWLAGWVFTVTYCESIDPAPTRGWLIFGAVGAFFVWPWMLAKQMARDF